MDSKRDSKRINRNDKFGSSVKKKDVTCVLSNLDVIQCECAHIVPLNGEYGQGNYKNPILLNDDANGMLLSKELHYLYDQFIWCINPNKYEELDGIPKKRKYNIEIASNYKEKNISINKYTEIIIRAECHHFIELAYSIFCNYWNPIESNYKKLELKQSSKILISEKQEVITIDKMSDENKIKLDQELNEIIINCLKNKKNFSKKSKKDMSLKYNIHEQSLESHYKKIKKNLGKRSI